ncbi:MAG: hypothetical protein ACRDJV_10480 [Actinomycetota bacterium]
MVGFFVALLIALVGWGLFWLTTRDEPRAEPDPSTGGEPGDGIRLTDEEAIARIENLTAMTIDAIRNRDSSLISRAFVTGSSLARDIKLSIRRLKQDGVVEQSRVRTLSWEVVSNTASEIRVRQTRITRFCFMSEGGKDVSQGPAAVREVGVWIMNWQSDEWLIDGNVGESERVVDESAARCP